MKRIILTSLFFCLAITTVLAQVTPDGNTTTDTTVLGSGDINIDIAAPDSNGLSNNTYSEFSATSSIYFNNDTSNPNFTDGDRASIIVNQVTSNSPSILEGRIQVSGHGAKIIIANPNGITCNGCEFISTLELDLVTGTYNIATGTYSISDNDITLGSGGLFLDGRVDLNIQTNNFNISGSGGVTTDTFNLNLAGDFNNSGTILVYKSFNITATDFNNSGTITVNNDFNETVDGFNITATNFNNSGTITVNGDLNATVDSFINESGATINATTDGCNIVATTSYTDNGTSNCQNSVDGTIVFNIATPVDGLSNNQVDDFDVNTDGTILNNSTGGGTAQLGSTAVTANPNITAGSEADLILLQVTGTGGSDLDGTIEVFGTEAGIIIANPNGITCSGCGFINADRVDLVTGTYDIATGTYSISDNDFTVDNGGLLASTVGVLNIQTNNFTNLDIKKDISADTFNLSVAGDFTIGSNAIINVNTFNISVAGDFISGNFAGIKANTFNFSLAGDFAPAQFSEIIANTFNFSLAGDFDDIVNYINNDFITTNNGQITVNAFNLNVGGDFTFSESANNFIWRENDTLTVSGSANITAASFNNSGTINVTNNSFNATVNTFINQAGARITAGECNIVATSSTDNGTITCLNSVGDAMVIDIANPDANGLSNNSYETFHISSNGIVLNNSDSDGTSQLAGDIPANPNYNSGDAASIILAQVSETNSLLFGTLEVVGAEAVVIIANPNGITCNGCGFINASRVDLVTGSNYNFNTDSFNSIANTNIAIIGNGLDASSVDILNIHAGGFTNTGGLKANTFNLNVAGNFASSGSITTDSFNITAGYTAINQGSIVSNSLDLTAHDFFRNLTGGDISVDSLNITAGGKVTNTANITVAGTLSITANNDSTRTDDPAGAFFYVSNRGNITATTLNIAAVDNFYNRGNVTADNFNITRAKDIFFLNEEIDSFYAAGHTYDGGTITLGGDSSFIAGGAIENYGNIDLTSSNNLDITANSFTNQAYANVTADTLNLYNVNSFLNEGVIDATINQ